MLNGVSLNPVTLVEAKGTIEDKPYLGKIKGEFFVTNGTSRNKRFYSKQLWEKELNKPHIRERVSGGRMFGTIGHKQPITDEALLEGKLSHIVTNLEIDESGQGLGEAVLLDTPAGRIAHAVYKAGGRLYVSSRAQGDFKGDVNGIPKVNEDTYNLSTFDIVLDPGFLKANPKLIESLSLNEDMAFEAFTTEILNNEPKKEFDMELKELMQENHVLKTSISELHGEIKSLAEATGKLKAELSESASKISDLSDSESELVEYQEIGSKEKIIETLKKAKDSVDALKKEVVEITEENDAFKEFGDLETCKKIHETIPAKLEELKSYQAFGSVDEVKEIHEANAKLEEEKAATEKASKIEELAKECGVSKETIELVYDSMEEDKIKEFILGIGSVKNTSESTNKPFNESFDKNKETDTKNVDGSTELGESVLRSLGLSK